MNQLRHSQDEVLSVIDKIMCAVVPDSSRACRDYRVKFPDDVLHESLAGQLWFGAEVCHLLPYLLHELMLGSTELQENCWFYVLTLRDLI